MQCSVQCWTTQRQRLQVRKPRTTAEDVGVSTARGCGDCCDSGSDVESGVTPIQKRLLRKDQSSGSDTMLEILEECIVFHYKRIYIKALYRRRKCAVQVKYSISTSVLYKKGNWA